MVCGASGAVNTGRQNAAFAEKYRALSAELKDIGHGQVIAVVRAPAYHDFSIRAKSLMSKSRRSKYHTRTKHVPNTNKSFTVSQLD
jgi:hypothetical protein